MTSILYKIQWGENSVHCVPKVNYCFGKPKCAFVYWVWQIIFAKNGYKNSSNLATPRQEADSHSPPLEPQQDFGATNKMWQGHCVNYYKPGPETRIQLLPGASLYSALLSLDFEMLFLRAQLPCCEEAEVSLTDKVAAEDRNNPQTGE